MARNRRIILTALLLTFVHSALLAQGDRQVIPNGYDEARHMYIRGHTAFVARRLDEALECYQAVDAFLDGNPKYEQSFDHRFRGFSMTEMVQRYRALGTFEPRYTHRILVNYIETVDAPWSGGRFTSHFSEGLKAAARLSREVCRLILEVLTGGELTLSFQEADVRSAVTEIEPAGPWDTRPFADRIVESLRPYPSDHTYEALDQYDSMIYYWNHVNDDGERVYDGYHGWGGVSRIPLVPHKLFGPVRGRIVISAGLIDRPGTLLHELFHTVEACYGIHPIHGFRDEIRHHYPEWKGTGEIDYYEHHLTAIRSGPGLGAFMIAENKPATIPRELYARLREAAVTLGEDRLRRSWTFTMQAKAEEDRGKALELYNAALENNPEYVPALLGRSTLHHKNMRREAALQDIRHAYELDCLDPEVCYWAGVEEYHAGRTDESTARLSEALHLDGSMTKALQYRSFVHYQSGDMENAIEDFRKLLSEGDTYREWVRGYLAGKESRGDERATAALEQLGLTAAAAAPAE